MKPLAIIIPAYKSTFLQSALDSIATQTCQDFTLYIGDDDSPCDIRGIVDRYRKKVDLVYKRFDNNLGGRNLVAQWERCIDMSRGEEWLWLFSDDDVMEPRCVEEFYRTKALKPESELFHFNVSLIDDRGDTLTETKHYPEHLTAYEYLDGKFHGQLNSFVVEFVFKRSLFLRAGRFVNFDLAWGSDMITWIKMADASKGIFTIDGPEVKWRLGNENISPDKSEAILLRKLHAEIDNACWIKEFLANRGKPFSVRWYKSFFGSLLRNRDFLSRKDGMGLIARYGNSTKLHWQSLAFLKYWNIVKAIGI